MTPFSVLEETLRKFKKSDSVPGDLLELINKLEKASRSIAQFSESDRQRMTKILLQASAYIAAHLPSHPTKEEPSNPSSEEEDFIRMMELEAEAIQLLQLQKQL